MARQDKLSINYSIEIKNMKDVLSSASKLVFIVMALAIVALTAIGVVDSKDFVMLAAMAFSFYFSKQNPTTNI